MIGFKKKEVKPSFIIYEPSIRIPQTLWLASGWQNV